MPLRIILLGSGTFALPPFRAVLDSEHDVVAVCTQPARTGRGHHRHVNPVESLAREFDVPVRKPERINQTDELDRLRSDAADAFIVAAYGQILSREFLAIPRFGAFNLHGSLLPRHRGASPVQYSIWKGDRDAGVTMFQIEPALDSGPVVGRVSTSIRDDETSGELMQRLAELSGPLTLDVLSQLEAGTVVFEPQDESLVTLAPKIGKDEGVIDWTQSATEIDCHIRAMQPWPKASTTLDVDGTVLRCILLQAVPLAESTTGEPGAVVESGRRLLVATGDGVIEIVRIQPQGKQGMSGTAFVNGYRVTTDSRFGM